MNHEDDLNYPVESTVNTCVYSVIDFMENYLKVHDRKHWKQNEFYNTVTSYNKKKHRYEDKKVPSFKVVYNGKIKTIFRDMPNSVINLIFSYAATYYKEIFFMMVLSAFTGMRPSEVCNVRQEISPLGKGLFIYKNGSKVQKIKIDLNEEKQLRSDLVSVGGIKKERWQEVHPKFYISFMKAYELHKEYLAEQNFEIEFCPMFVDRHGMAMTYDNYYRLFRKMIDELKHILVKSPDQEISTYGLMLLQNNISPHIFRHWYSVNLVLYGEDVAGLQHWRGDKSPLSAINYLKNKGELAKQLAYTNEAMFHFMLDAATDMN
jgi:integrase